MLGNHAIASGMLLSSALAVEVPALQYRIILVARKDAVSGPRVKPLAAAYRSADFRKFIESDPKARGFSRPDSWR